MVTRLREEAEEAELKEGMADAPVTVKEETNGTSSVNKDKTDKMDVDQTEKENGEAGEVADAVKITSKSKGKGKAPKKDKVAEMGLVGQEAIKMRRELRVKRKAEYKKMLEKTCEAAFFDVRARAVANGQTILKKTKRLQETLTKRCSYHD